MTKSEFLLQLKDILQSDTDINADCLLAELDDWDSLAFMAIITLYRKQFNIHLTFENIIPCKTVADIIALANGAIV